MSERSRDLSFAAAVIVLIVAAVAFDLSVGDTRATGTSAAQTATFFDRTSFCPATADQDGSTYLAATPASSTDVTVGIRPEEEETRELPVDKMLLHKNVQDDPLSVVGYGGPIRVGAIETFPAPAVGAGAARCSSAASAHWYFPDGSTALGFDERIALYNPFPDEAVADINLYTPGGVKVKANLTDLAVPTGRGVVVRLNEFALQQKLVAVEVSVDRGRVVAWKSVAVDKDSLPSGVQLTLGASMPQTTWYLPEGGIADGLDERLTLLNPGPDEAIVTASIMTAEETLQPPKLVEIRIPGSSVKQMDLTAAAGRSGGKLGGTSVIVRSANGVGVVAERTIYYSGDDLHGTSTEIGSYKTAPGWVLPPALVKPVTESVVVMNPTTEEVNVRIKLVGATGEPLEPQALRATIPAGARFKFALGQTTKARPMFAFVTADGEIVAERVAYSGRDVATVIGWPSTPNEQ